LTASQSDGSPTISETQTPQKHERDSTYITENFEEIAKASGLTHVRSFNAFVSKVMVFDKPGKPL
jgi:hypothetical protein